MTIQYLIREVDLYGKKIRMTCFSDELPEGMPFELDTSLIWEGDRYPEGERLDQVIEAHLPRAAFQAKVKARRHEGSTSAPVEVEARPDFAPPFAAEGEEKVYLSRTVNRIRTLNIPVEIC